MVVVVIVVFQRLIRHNKRIKKGFILSSMSYLDIKGTNQDIKITDYFQGQIINFLS